MVLIILIILISLNIIGEEFKINLEVSSKEAILEEPIYVCLEAEYIGKGRITIAKDAFVLEIYIEKAGGGRIKEKSRDLVESIKMPYNEFEEAERGWRRIKCEEINSRYYIDIGEYYIWGVAKSKGPYHEKIGNIIREKRAWEGEITTGKKEIKVKYPEGEDREAYEYFKNSNYKTIPYGGEGAKELLQKFPTSTYAGWVLYNISNINFIEKLNINSSYRYSIRTKEDVKKNYQGSYTEKDIERVLKEMEKEKQEARERIKFLEDFIKQRPDFPLREYVEFEIAFWSFYTGDYKKAKEGVNKILMQSKNSLLIEKSKEIYDLLKKENLVK